MAKDTQLYCDSCGWKLHFMYASIGNKKYCRRSCYEMGVKDGCENEMKEKLADEHRREEATRKTGCWDENYPDNTEDC